MAVTETDSPLRAARKARGLRLVDVAARAGIAVSYLSMIERGLPASERVRDKLAAALERPASRLFPGGQG